MAQMELDIENLYIERNQELSADVAGEYARHFTGNELVVGASVEARLRKALLGAVTRDKVAALHALHRSSNSCVVKVAEHAPSVTVTELLQVRS